MTSFCVTGTPAVPLVNYPVIIGRMGSLNTTVEPSFPPGWYERGEVICVATLDPGVQDHMYILNLTNPIHFSGYELDIY